MPYKEWSLESVVFSCCPNLKLSQNVKEAVEFLESRGVSVDVYNNESDSSESDNNDSYDSESYYPSYF